MTESSNQPASGRRFLLVLILCVSAFLVAVSVYAVMHRWRFIKVSANASEAVLYRVDHWTGEMVQVFENKSYEVLTPNETRDVNRAIMKLDAQ